MERSEPELDTALFGGVKSNTRFVAMGVMSSPFGCSSPSSARFFRSFSSSQLPLRFAAAFSILRRSSF